MSDSGELALALVQSELKELSFVAHRDLNAALPAIEPYGIEATALWAETGRDLFLYDRDAGKAFLRQSPELARATSVVTPWTRQAREFLTFRGSWKALTAYLERFAEAQAAFGAERALAWGAIGLDWGRRHLGSAEIYFATPVAELTDGRGWDGAREVLDPLQALAAERGLLPGLALPGAIKVRALLGPDALRPWLARGAEVLKSGRLRGEAFFRLEGPESEEALLAGLPGFRTQEHERFLALLARAVLGQAPPFASGGLRFGARAFIETDGRTLFWPPAFPSRDEAIAALLHHAGHLAFGSYDEPALEGLFREAGLEHPPLDSDQRITWRPLFALFGEDMVRFQLLFDLCEDLRVDARVQARFPRHVPRLLALAHVPPTGAARPYYEAARASLAGLLDGGQETGRFTPLLAPDADLVTSWRVARAWYEEGDMPPLALADRALAYLPGRSPNSQRPVYPRSRGARVNEEVEEGGGAAAVEKRETKPAPVGPGHDPDLEITPEDTSGSGGRVGVGRPQPAAVSGYRRSLLPPGEGLPYPEWDYREKAYRRDWARVQERALIERDASCAQSLLAQHAGVLRRLRRALQAEKPRRASPHRRQLEGEELDLDATVTYVVDRRTGERPQPAVYRKRRPSQRDTKVLLLADLSTSIMQEAATGDGRVVDRLKAALLLFALSLEEIGDEYAIAGFASRYRNAVSYYPIKTFSERLTADTRAVLGGLSGRLATRMGAAIRHACARFETSGGRRLLLLLSDGRPADYDDGGDERYLHEDTRMAVKEAADRGVHAFCVTLDPAGAPYLERIFGRGHYLIIDTLDELPAKLPQIYLKLRRA